jgi:hypothetical protein
LGIDFFAWFGHVSEHVAELHDTEHDGTVQVTSHVEPLVHDAEHDVPAQVISHVALFEQSTLPESWTVTVQCESSQCTLPLCPVSSVHVLPAVH